MKKILKRGLSLVLAMIMVVGLLPVTAYAKVDSTGKPLDLANKLVLSIYTPEGSFPGEPAMHGSSEYISFNSSFQQTSASGQFKSSAESELNENVLDDVDEGASNGNNTVWGVFSADGLKEKYFKSDASIIQPANEAKIIRAIKGTAVNGMTDAEILDQYEIIWYVIKLQHSPGWFSWSSGTTEWHIDGLIKEKTQIKTVAINYYGNGNSTGSAPDGVTNHTAGEPYTILGSNMTKKMNGVSVDFLGWSAQPDGSGEFYLPGAVISPEENVSLYAMWDTTTQYTATVNTYLDGVLTDAEDIHGSARSMHLSTDQEHYYALTRSSEGVYTTKITGNGKFHLYNKSGSTYTQIGDRQLTIYNQNGTMDVHHYSITYDANGGSFETAPAKQVYYYGDTVTAIADVPTREGYRFQGWKAEQEDLIQPNEQVSASITAPIKLTAQWEKTVNVTINVTINHNEEGGGFDKVETKDDVFLALVSRENDTSPYLEVEGKTLSLSDTSHAGFEYTASEAETKYTGYTYTDMPGGDVDYTVVTSKSGYDTEIEATQDEDGNWVIDVEMTYTPTNFDLAFTVEVDSSVPAEYIPDAAIVKVTFWATDRNQWELITQQRDNLPGVRVDLGEDGKGTGSYPVWKYESDSAIPYGYRVKVTSFVYPDGTIVPASKVLTEDVAWTDNVYTATVSDVTDGEKFGTLDGAYIGTDGQKGKLNVVISMDLHDVTFDAQGGKVNGQDQQLVKDQYRIPDFKDYVPTRAGGYTFGGWYEDAACTTAATEGEDLTQDITLYAKWIEPRTVRGTVTIAGTYDQNGEKVYVHGIDKATEAVIVLQEIRNGEAVEVNSQTIEFADYSETGSAAYAFTQLPNDGKQYQIHVMVLNYNTGYDNNQDQVFGANEYGAVFGTGNVAVVDAHLDFAPPSYTQYMGVDATQIGAAYRPEKVLTQVLYRDTGDNHPYRVISQHDVEPYGVEIRLPDGTGTGSQSIWNWHTDGTLYDYQMNITKVDNRDYDSDSAPYYITYSAANNALTPDVVLQAVLIPHKYPVTFDLNAGTDTVTGMEDFLLTYQDEDGNTVITQTHGVVHTWSYDTAITAVPEREGYTFLGWEADADGVYDDGKIPAGVHQEVTLTAKWEKKNYTVTTVSDPEEGGTTSGAGTYPYGEQITVSAAPQTGYRFCGWYEGETLVSEDAQYTFTVTGHRNLIARFARNPYKVDANATTGGTTTGTGIYEFGQTATVTATAEAGYAFLGWFEDTEIVSGDASYSFTVTADRTLTAKFSRVHTITVIAETGGTVSGGGTYAPMANATITAAPNYNYYFVGWYNEANELVTANASHSLTVTEDRTFTAKFEKKVSYSCDYVYLFGYDDTQIGAEGPLLRSELAQMIYRLVRHNGGARTSGKVFEDTAGKWFQSGMAYMAQVGAIDGGQTNGRPYVSVTRGETYKMICLGLKFTTNSDLSFSEYATILRNSGYLEDDGRVTATIQRWEFCKLFNAILGRTNYALKDAEGNEITPATYGYTDLKSTDFYYRIMMIATSNFKDGLVDREHRRERNEFDYDN